LRSLGVGAEGVIGRRPHTAAGLITQRPQSARLVVVEPVNRIRRVLDDCQRLAVQADKLPDRLASTIEYG